MNLKIARHIVKQDWMRSSQTERLFTVLQGGDAVPCVLFVGGCVRNALMRREVEDVDLATTLRPEEVMARLEAQSIRVIPTGIDHGTVTAVMDGHVYEITTLRRDVETDGRRAVVAYADCWVEDARRRDFTMNTLLLDLQGNIYDPLGCGLDDLDAGRVVFVGDAAQRIKEDYLRILRYFRFHALYGSGEMDGTALRACAEGSGGIDTLSRERVTQEFFKIMVCERAPEILEVMFAHGILASFRFADYDGDFFRHFCMFQSRYGLGAVSSRLFVMANMNFDNIRTMERHVIFPKVFLRDMEAISGALNLPDLSCDRAVRESVYRFGRSVTAQCVMIELVQDQVMNGYAPTALKIIQSWDVPDFPLNGKDIMDSGIKEGVQVGKTLHALENWWIAQDFKPDRQECLRQVLVLRV